MPEMTDAQLVLARQELTRIAPTIIRTVLGGGTPQPDARMLYITIDHSLRDGFQEVKHIVQHLELCEDVDDVRRFLPALKTLLQNLAAVSSMHELKMYDCPHCKGPRPHCNERYGQ